MGDELSIPGLYEVFKSINGLDGNGTLDKAKLKLFLEKASLSSNLERPEAKDINLDTLFNYIDVDSDGQIEFIEFILYLEDVHGDDFSPQIKLLQGKAKRAVGNALGKGLTYPEQLTLHDLKEVFKKIDEDNSISLYKEE